MYMNHWIDRNSETDNVIIVSDTTIFVGSCDEDVYDKVDQQLSAGTSPVEVLGSGDLTTIPYSQIQNVTSRSTDNDVSINYKAKKEIEEETLFFDSLDDKQEFVSALDELMPEHLVRSEIQQSALGASLSPFISLALSLASIYFFINKFRWLTIIVGGIWALVSLYMLVSRAGSPPTITRWTIGGRYARKLWAGIKTVVSYAILAVVIVVIHEQLPDAWGPKSLYQQLQFESLSPASVETMLGRGADIDYASEEGETVLWLALDWGEDDIAIALINAGADLTITSDDDRTPIEHAIYYDLNLRVVEAMLDKGESLEFEIEGMTPLEYARENEYLELASFLSQYPDHF